MQFRIPFSDVLVLTNCEEPSNLRKQRFKSLVEKFMVDDKSNGQGNKLSLTKQDLLKFKGKL